MREWLQQQADEGHFPGLKWMDEDRTLLRIPWCHGSRSEWNEDCFALFKAWAEYKGLYTESDAMFLKNWPCYAHDT